MKNKQKIKKRRRKRKRSLKILPSMNDRRYHMIMIVQGSKFKIKLEIIL